MATTTYSSHTSSPRGLAMVLALVSAVVLSPLYVNPRNDSTHSHYTKTRWNSAFFLPMLLAGLIIAIKTTSSSSSSTERAAGDGVVFSSDPSWVLRIGSSSWGLVGVLVMLMLVLSWQDSVHHFFSR